MKVVLDSSCIIVLSQTGKCYIDNAIFRNICPRSSSNRIRTILYKTKIQRVIQ